jgi:chromate reductase, NAD(P)H dehydrogenase (quinone)
LPGVPNADDDASDPPAHGEGADADRPVELLLVSGSLRGGSTNSAALRTVAGLAPPDVRVTVSDHMAALPHFDPDADVDPLDPAVARMRAAVAAADAVLFCTPEYAGALPGSFKNLLDWIVGGGELIDKPVAWINVAAPGRGARAHESLAVVLAFLTAAIVDDACADVPVARQAVGDDGVVTDEATRAALAASAAALVAAARARRG